MKTKKVYVSGKDVRNSLSPLIFNYWFSKYKINAEYKYKEIKPKNFDNSISKIFGVEVVREHKFFSTYLEAHKSFL